MATIVGRRRGKEIYYYCHSGMRIKLSPSDHGGKGPGSGPSKVVSKDIYLGTADTVLQRLREGPVQVHARSFGLEMAALSVIREIGLVEAVDSVVPKRGQGMSVGNYLALGIVVKLASPHTGWHTFPDWLARTALPDHFNLPRSLLDAQNFWDAFDKILPEAPYRRRRGKDPEAVMDDEVVLKIEEQIWRRVREHYQVALDTILYDTTNFFTYIAKENPAELPRNGHNKAGRHERRQVSLALAITRRFHLPLLHLVYPGNVHDATLFPGALRRLVQRVAALARDAVHLVLVFDRGQNSKDNLHKVRGCGMHAVGGLSWAHHKDLLEVPLADFRETEDDRLIAWEGLRDLWGLPVNVVITYNAVLAKKQRLALAKILRTLRANFREAHGKHRRATLPKQRRVLEKVSCGSRAGRYVAWSVDEDGRLHLAPSPAFALRVKQCGRRLLFSTDTGLHADEVIHLYNRDKAAVEEGIEDLKSPDLIRIQPLRAWTDTKIRVYALICVLALLVLRLMAMKASPLGLSAKAMCRELEDIREVIMVYSLRQAQRKVTALSTTQSELFRLFDLEAFTKKAGPELGVMSQH